MNIRIKFEKTGNMKYIGHLDTMRYFQKAIRRAEIDIAYSEGFSPHMIMSFALPLGVGVTSLGEYMDISVNSTRSSNDSVYLLNKQMAEGFWVTSYNCLPPGTPNAMSSVRSADYAISFVKGSILDDWNSRWEDFVAQDNIFYEKEGKKSRKRKNKDASPVFQTIDLKERIELCQFVDDKLLLRCVAGSAANLNPALLLDAFYNQYFNDYERPYPFAARLERLELYDENKLPLEKSGDKIEL